MMKTVNRKVGYLILIVGLVACSAKSVKNSEEKDTDSVSIEVPSFDTDSAYAYIERQVQFGFTLRHIWQRPIIYLPSWLGMALS